MGCKVSFWRPHSWTSPQRNIIAGDPLGCRPKNLRAVGQIHPLERIAGAPFRAPGFSLIPSPLPGYPLGVERDRVRVYSRYSEAGLASRGISVLYLTALLR